MRLDFDALEISWKFQVHCPPTGVGVQTQIKFKVWKSEFIIMIVWNFAGQKNADQQIVKASNFLMETEKTC